MMALPPPVQVTSKMLLRMSLLPLGLPVFGVRSLSTRSLTFVSAASYSTVKVNTSLAAHLTSCTSCAGSVIPLNGAIRRYSSPASKPKPSRGSGGALQESKESQGGAVTLTTAEKVKENVKTASYGGVIIVGVLIGGAMLYYVLNELFSSESPQNIYSHAFKMCKISSEVQDALGTPIKCYGEESRRGWRRHVACQEFLVGNTKFLRMRFYIEGQFKKGTVNVEKKTNDRGKYEYTYIIVEVDGYPPRRIEVPF